MENTVIFTQNKMSARRAFRIENISGIHTYIANLSKTRRVDVSKIENYKFGFVIKKLK